MLRHWYTEWYLLVVWAILAYLLVEAGIGVVKGYLSARRFWATVRSILTCRRCGRVEYLTFASGDQFFCCQERMHKEVRQ